MRRADLSGVKSFKSWGSYFNHVKSTMSDLHEMAFRPKTSQMSPLTGPNVSLKGYNLPTPAGASTNPNTTLAGIMSDMRNNASMK